MREMFLFLSTCSIQLVRLVNRGRLFLWHYLQHKIRITTVFPMWDASEFYMHSDPRGKKNVSVRLSKMKRQYFFLNEQIFKYCLLFMCSPYSTTRCCHAKQVNTGSGQTGLNSASHHVRGPGKGTDTQLQFLPLILVVVLTHCVFVRFKYV